MITKRCINCGIEKELFLFSNNKASKDGKKARCKDCLREERRSYYLQNKEKEMQRHKKYYDKHRSRLIEYTKQYNLENKEKISQYLKEYRKTENGKTSAKNHSMNRRLQKKIGSIKTKELKEFLLKKTKCYWCEKNLKDNFHIDHYIPLSKGGAHSIDNLVLSCHSCNLKKSNKDPFEFAISLQRLL